MKRSTKELLLLILVTVFSTLLLWWPFFGGFSRFLGFEIPPGGMKTVFANYDGPNYLIIAKTWYQKELIGRLFSLPLPLEYYPAHFPGYPALIRLGSLFLAPPWAMLIANLFSSMAAVFVFYRLITDFNLSQKPFWLSFVFLFLPARLFAVRSVGAPESFFVFAILTSIYFFRKQRYWLAGGFGALAQATKSPAILLFAAYGLYYLIRERIDLEQSGKSVQSKINSLCKTLPLFLIPLTLMAVFFFYQNQTGNFWAYFHSGDNFHLTPFPFQSFNASRSWLGQIWIEDMVWLYLIGAIGILLLFKKKQVVMGFFALIFYLATVFVAHRDISRYLLPAWPFLLIGLEPLIIKREFRIAFWFILPAIYFFSLNFILGNTAPVADWTPYF
ncbi:MAG: hypothetical protein JW991_04110 [Candidatus Pacebacteria bacterium]|nr:hypothetical protein [Candidatus Paceibacterota bacterium]